MRIKLLVRIELLLIAACLLGGCTCHLIRTLPPSDHSEELSDGEIDVRPVVFATNRMPMEGNPPPDPCEHGWFGPERGGELLRGMAITELAHHDGWIHPTVIAMEQVDVATGRIVTDALNLNGEEAIVYIHGFHTSFQEAIVTGAIMGRFLPLRFMPVVFSWPAGIESTFLASAYFAERESADLSVLAFKQMISELCALKNIKKIHLVAHSTGAWILCRGLEELIREGRGHEFEEQNRLGQIVLASADIDLDVFRHRFAPIAPRLRADRITAYVATDDQVLGISSFLRADLAPRVGEINIENEEHLRGLESITLIDVTDLDGKANLGHSYLISQPRVCSDLLAILMGVPNQDRNLEQGSAANIYRLEE